MIQQLFAIIRNTFFESIRQPVMLVVVVAAVGLIVLSNPLSAFTMEDDQRMLIHMGMATVFSGSALLAAFIATSVLTREIDNRTALTVISKPVGRPLFVIGKYLGVAGAMIVSILLMSFVFLLVEQHAVLETVRDPVHVPVVTFGVGAALLAVGIAVWCNYFYGTAFCSTLICTLTPLLGLAYFFSLLFRPDFSLQPVTDRVLLFIPVTGAFKPQLWLALASLTVATLVLTAIAVAASTRLGQVMTLSVTVGAFLLGLLSDWIFGRPLRMLTERWLARASAEGLTETETVTRTILLTTGEPRETQEVVEVATVPLAQMAEGWEFIGYAAARTAYAIVPNFQVLWLSDAVTQKHVIPASYLLPTMTYGLLYVVVAMGLAVLLFQRREVG